MELEGIVVGVDSIPLIDEIKEKIQDDLKLEDS